MPFRPVLASGIGLSRSDRPTCLKKRTAWACVLCHRRWAIRRCRGVAVSSATRGPATSRVDPPAPQRLTGRHVRVPEAEEGGLASPGMALHEVRAGLWHWQAPHPEWAPGAPWPQEVSSYAIDDGERLLLFDPLAVPDELLARAPERRPVIVLTAPWHERDTRALAGRLGAALFAPRPDTAQDLMDKFGVTAEEAGDGSPDLRWLRDGGAEVHWYGDGDRLPMGIEAFAGREHNDLVLWQESARAIIAGDTLVDFGAGFRLAGRLRGGVTAQAVAAGLRPLLERPVEVVCPVHGTPTDRAALERALAP
jgi:hypothetical protein